MNRQTLFIFCLLIAASGYPGLAQGPVSHHDLRVELEPSEGKLSVQDRWIPASREHQGELTFVLNADLMISSVGPDWELEEIQNARRPLGRLELKTYRLKPVGTHKAGQPIPLTYSGLIRYSVEQEAEEYARSFAATPGMVGAEGVFLAGSSAWIPVAQENELASFDLKVSLPGDWTTVSQGERTASMLRDGRREEAWSSPEPNDEVYLIAAPFQEYSRDASGVKIQAYLRQPDPGLAAKYLEAGAQYVEMYSKMLAPYPYKKFALVENFWETGYGMPSFTLLGPQVIRLPFILHSSYPHEILHNWWGNSVYVDYESGNWCEGLTAYLADHLVKEGQGQGSEYRRDSLKRYLDFVSEARDFPLRDFRSRHSPSTEAVGYGKSLMLWHMLRMELGDRLFLDGLRRFYVQFQFQRASFQDAAKVFSEVAGRDLGPFFRQWVDREGAPELSLAEVGAKSSGSSYHVTVKLKQVQPSEVFRLRVPLVLTLEGAAQSDIRYVEMNTREATVEFEVQNRPLLVQLDPEYDLFRRLDRAEIPASLSQLFGAEKLTFVVPGPDDSAPVAAWMELAAAWSGPGRDVEVVSAGEFTEWPKDRAVWVLGASNPWGARFEERLAAFGARVGPESVVVAAEKQNLQGGSFVFVLSHPDTPDLAVGWLGTQVPEAVAGLARKIPHYGKYSYLAFSGSEPTNSIKGQWTSVGSPLSRNFDGADGVPAAFPPREALGRLAPVFDQENLKAWVERLASPELEGRGVGTAGLQKAGDWIAEKFREFGLEPAGQGGTFFQSWQELDGPRGESVTLRNVVARLAAPGSDNLPVLVVGAHYDHLGSGWPEAREGETGRLHPGADDNASGVAVLLEVARVLSSDLRPARDIIFVAFSGEEWGLRGSRHFIDAFGQEASARVFGMMNLDSVGRLGERKLFMLGSGTATEWIHIARGIGFTTGVESTAVSDDLGASDQRSFIEKGVPAVQIFAGAHPDYHRSSDVPATLDWEGMVKVATFVREAVAYLGDRREPLTTTISGQSEQEIGSAPASGSRRASLGTLPDFAFPGPGVRVESVGSGSPAEKAGIRAGDVIVSIDGELVRDLRHYSEILRAHQPGDRIALEIDREGQKVQLEAELTVR